MSYAIFTLLYTVVSVAIFLSCLMLALFRRKRPMIAYTWSFAFVTASALLLSQQSNGNHFFTIALGNAFIIMSSLMLYFGTRLFYESEARWPKRFWVYLLGSIAVFAWFTLVQYNLIARSISLGVFSTVLFLDFFFYLGPYFRVMLAPVRAAFISALLVTEASFVGRIVLAVTTLNATDLGVDAEELNIFILVTYTVASIFWLTMLILLDDSKLLEELQKQNLLLEPLAHTDKLTGLFNRNKLYEMLSDYVDITNRLEKPLTFILIDIDRFKNVNDTFGHAVGDTTLIHLADIIRRGIRTTDRAFRWGGEEFLILAVGTSADGGVVLAENLRRKVAAEPFETVLHITASFGVAEQLPHERFEDWFRRTDYALYQAKNAGRNRVMKADPVILPLDAIMPGNLELSSVEGFATSADHPARAAENT